MIFHPKAENPTYGIIFYWNNVKKKNRDSLKSSEMGDFPTNAFSTVIALYCNDKIICKCSEEPNFPADSFDSHVYLYNDISYKQTFIR